MRSGLLRARAVLLVVLLLLPGAGLGWWHWCERLSRSLWEQAERAARREDWRAVQMALERFDWYRPGESASVRLGAHAAWKLGQDDRALDLLDAIGKGSPEYAAARLQKGLVLVRQLRLSEAEAAFRACLKRDPESDEAARQLLLLLGIERRTEEHDARLWRLLEAGPRPRALLALILLAAGPPSTSPTVLVSSGVPDGELEEAVLRQWLAADPGNSAVRPLLAERLRREGRRDEVLRLLEPWLERHPDDFAARAEWLAVLLEDRDLGRVRAWLDPIPAAVRGQARFWTLRGDWLAEQGDDQKALAAYRESIRIEPREVEPLFRAVQILRGRGDTGDADQLFSRLRDLQVLKTVARRISEKPDASSVPLWKQAALLCKNLGRLREAEAWLDHYRSPGLSLARTDQGVGPGSVLP